MDFHKDFIHQNHQKADYPHVLETVANKVYQVHGIFIIELKKE